MANAVLNKILGVLGVGDEEEAVDEDCDCPGDDGTAFGSYTERSQ